MNHGAVSPALLQMSVPVHSRRFERSRSMSAMPPIAPAKATCRPVAKGHDRTHAPQQFCRYSITSSAMESTPAGMVRPSALAVLRLINNSNLVGRSTGKSAGFAPFRIRST
jgi:hypothetical protein